MNIVDLFAGVGGLSLGFRQEKYNILLSTDIDEDCKDTYTLNWPKSLYLCEDIRKITPKTLQQSLGASNVEIIVGGPPCKGFSTIGARASSDEMMRKRFDERNFLFRDFVKVVNKVGPKIFLFENVSGLLNFNNGFIFEEIKNSFRKIGYKIEHNLLDAVNYGVPQYRKRVFIVGRKRNKEIGFPPISYKWAKHMPCFKTVGEVISDLAGLENNFPNHIPLNHGDKNIRRYKFIPEGGRMPEDKLPSDLYRKNFGNTFKRLDRNKPSLTMVPGHNAFPIHPWLHRSLTVREAARIQTFPDDIIFTGPRHSQCLQVGNAVPVNLARAWAIHLKNEL